MKIKYIVLASFFVAFLLACSSVFEQIYVDTQDNIYKSVRQEIADPSVFTIMGRQSILVSPKNTPATLEMPCPDNSLGTAFVITKDGYAITATHVVNMEEEYNACLETIKKELFERKMKPDDFIFSASVTYQIKTAAGEILPAKFIASSPTVEKDTALVFVETKDKREFKPIPISTATDLSDQSVAVIGAPFGYSDIVVMGKIARAAPFEKKRMMINAPIYPGNSGGPAISLADKKVVGMVDAVLLLGGSPTNIATMTSAKDIREFLHEVLPDHGF